MSTKLGDFYKTIHIFLKPQPGIPSVTDFSPSLHDLFVSQISLNPGSCSEFSVISFNNISDVHNPWANSTFEYVVYLTSQINKGIEDSKAQVIGGALTKGRMLFQKAFG